MAEQDDHEGPEVSDLDLKTGADVEFAWADGSVMDWKTGVATIQEKRVNGDVALIKGAPWGV